MLEEKLREKSDGLNELILKKELVDRQVLIQGEEIKRLEETNASTTRKLLQLQEELETQRRAVRALQQVSTRGLPLVEVPAGPELLGWGFLCPCLDPLLYVPCAVDTVTKRVGPLGPSDRSWVSCHAAQL